MRDFGWNKRRGWGGPVEAAPYPYHCSTVTRHVRMTRIAKHHRRTGKAAQRRALVSHVVHSSKKSKTQKLAHGVQGSEDSEACPWCSGVRVRATGLM